MLKFDNFDFGNATHGAMLSVASILLLEVLEIYSN